MLVVIYMITHLKIQSLSHACFGFTVTWIVRIVHVGCKSFVFSTQIPWGT